MKADYVPNEKYRNMFGVERNGYGMERVDLYLAQLEVAFKKIREDNRNLKRELSGRAQPPPNTAAPGGTLQQEHFIAQLQNQLHGEQEKNHHMHQQLQEMQARLADAKGHAGAAAPGAANEQLVAQLNALRSEADYLRQQLRQSAVVAPGYSASMDVDVKDIMNKMLGEARQKAAEITTNAQKDADQIVRKARQRVDELRIERDRVCAQLQGIAHSVRSALNEPGEPAVQTFHSDYAQDDFGSSLPTQDYMADYRQTG